MRYVILQVVAWCYVFHFAYAQDIPNPKQYGKYSYVSNRDDVLTTSEVMNLNRLLAQFERESGAQMAVVVVRSLNGMAAKPMATELLNRWGVGQRGKDNGVLLLVVIESRTWAFEVGYGLEPILTDYVTAYLGNQVLASSFRKKAYEKGLTDAIQEILILVKNPDLAKEIHQQAEKEVLWSWVEKGWVLAVILLFLFGLYGVIFDPYHKIIYPLALGSLALTAVEVLFLILQWFGVEVFLPVRWVVGGYLGVGIAWLMACIGVGRNDAIPYKRHPALYLVLIDHIRYCKLKILFPLFWATYVLWAKSYANKQKVYIPQKRFKSEAKKPFRGIRRLSKTEKEPHLNNGEKVEEALQTIRHDVWVDAEGKVVEKVPCDLKKFGFQACGKCKHQTMSGEYENERQKKYVYRCKNCGYFYEAQPLVSSASGPVITYDSPSSSDDTSPDRTSFDPPSDGVSSWGGGASGGAGASGTW